MILSSLLYQLSDLAWYVFYFAWAIVAIACFRLSKRGADKTFAISAWLAIAGVALTGFPWMIGWATAYLPGRPDWIGNVCFYLAKAANIAYFGHLVAFAVAAFHTATRLPAQPRAISGSGETSD
ncbi:hypothetical protein [Luteolibacter soli]|uniref:Uncharacterized protein n=1 Tax=Luteolibacter soli TaxID=3135280 RepID=A0ABU9APA4_9BACT